MPELYNKTPLTVESYPLIDATGRNVAVVIAKGTYHFDALGTLRLAHVPEKINIVDDFTSGANNLRIASDLADFKPATDIVLIRPQPDVIPENLLGRLIKLRIENLEFGGTISDPWRLGPIPRDAEPRKSFAGTYDQKWIDSRAPLLPENFSAHHHQIARPSQIYPGFVRGDEQILMTDIFFGTSGDIAIGLPGKTVVVSRQVRSHYGTEVAKLDTIAIWCDQPKLTLVWRFTIRPRQKIAEIRNIFVYYTSLRTARELFGAT